MGTPGGVPPAAGRPGAPELLSWERPVPLVGESRPPQEGERGFLLRLHADAACPERLRPDGPLVVRSYEQARAADLCPACSTTVVATSASSTARRLRDAERTLRRLQARALDAPVPRELAHCRALRDEAQRVVSVHPQVRALAERVHDLAGEVAEALREGLRRRLADR